MGKSVILLMSIFIFVGCKTIKYVPIEKEIERIVTVTERDTSIIVEHDEATLTALLLCDSTNKVLLNELHTKQGNRTNIDYNLSYNDNQEAVLNVDCNTDSLELEISIRDSLIQELTTLVKVVEVERSLNWYEKTMIRLGWCLIALIVGIVGWKVFKWYGKIRV
jgi:hypothetical protein